ncbi:MAG TPA: hypothetical protein VK920_05610 [Solirubrobacterales bacterium]|nr:hypothetical protein [Solirubrobacterales bacterium]
MADEWRVEVELGDEQHHLTLGERLRSLDLDDEARRRLGDRVIVTRDGAHMFLYAGSEPAAREAERVARELVASEGLAGQVRVTRWDDAAEAWTDASGAPGPAADLREHEQAWSEPDWEVRIDVGGLRETLDLARRLEDEGLEVRRRWHHLLVGADTEGEAGELAKRLASEVPEGANVRVEPSGVPHPVFVFMGAHTPGIARDLGL